MMNIRSFLLAFCILCSGNVYPEKRQNLDSLRSHILEFSQDYFLEKYEEMYGLENIQVKVGNIDKRLRLEACDDFLTFEMREPPYGNGTATIKVQCVESHNWSIYVPIKTEIFGEILVVDKSLSRGHVIEESDLLFQRTNLSSLKRGFVQTQSQVVGMELKRHLARGAVINLSHVKKPNIITKGQEVVVESKSSFLSVESTAVALNSGHEGQQIKVKNLRSNRVVAGIVVAPGRVSVSNKY